MAVLFCALGMNLAIPLLPLLVGIGGLSVFAMFAAWRLTQPWPVREWETIGHVAFDTLILGYLLYFTGGATNPFVTLLVVPIALSAAALSIRATYIVAALAVLAYLVLVFWYVPLPVPTSGRHWFTLQVAGMGVNFVIMASLLGFFINRLARALRVQQREMQRVRERALRGEGILAIATQAAGAAHELNTPLSTMRTLLPELLREHAGQAALEDDLTLLQEQVERCRTILRDMVAFGRTQLSQESAPMSLRTFIHGCRERFQLLRPEADLTLDMDAAAAETVIRIPPGLRHALINLLNNAVDASNTRDSQNVALDVRCDTGWLVLRVRDHGPGFDTTGTPTVLGQSHKESGLGIGLTLAEATAERLRGELLTHNTDDGAEVTLRLPLAVIANP
jgi:two-component system sensor histidine kinase RegB